MSLWKNLRSSPKRLLIFLLLGSFIGSVIVNLLLMSFGRGIWGIGLPSEMAHYEGKLFSFSIDYPKSWTLKETSEGIQGDKEVIVWIYPSGIYSTQVLIEEKTFQNPNIEMVIYWRVDKYLRTMGEYKEVSASIVDRSGQAYYEHYFTWQRPNIFYTVSLECQEYAFLKDNKGYSILICAEKNQWNQFGKVFHRILDSFSIE